MRREWERDFVDYVATRSAALRRTAFLLCGDWHQAEDLTQLALAKLYAAWRRIDRAGSIDAYARKTLPRSQRAVVVLRYWDDLSVAETASWLQISEGTVKSASARGLAALREGLQGSRNDELLSWRGV
jgi:DNA-directed RNA polymerase specialized sigma24 family protein